MGTAVLIVAGFSWPFAWPKGKTQAALSTGEVLAWDSRSKIAEPSPPDAGELQVGQSGYIGYLWTDNGKVYVGAFTTVRPEPNGYSSILIKRVADGFMVAPGKLVITPKEKHQLVTLIPVVGKLEDK